MDILSSVLPLVTLTATSLLCVSSHEVNVSGFSLKLCDGKCFTEVSNCGLQPPSPVHNPLNMSCYFDMLHNVVTCEWGHETDGHAESDVSLIFSSKKPIISCGAVLTMSSILTITVRIKSYNTDSEIWSQLQDVFLGDVVKPPPPDLKYSGSTVDSVVVTWDNNSYSSCRLRYRGSDTQSWSLIPDSATTHHDHTLTFTITGLLPFNDYVAAVACSEDSDIWSDWSDEVKAQTRDRVPCEPPGVCYQVDNPSDSSGRHTLRLMWKALDPRDAGGRVLGYQVSYRPVKTQQLWDSVNTTEASASLEVKGGAWNVTVRAFNTAGYGPAATLCIDTQSQNYVRSVTNMWVSSSLPPLKDLVVEWKIPPAPAVSRFDVRWHVEADPSTSRWSSVDGCTASFTVRDLAPGECYLISVVPVYGQQCGSPRSLPASPRQGALMEPNSLKVIGVTTTTVTVGWVWQRKSGPLRVERYRAMLRRDSESQTLTLWPDQRQHTFFKLAPSTEYALVLLADNVSRIIIPVKTDFDTVPVVAAATPLLLLAVALFTVSVLSRTVYKWFFFPHISSPQGSTTGQWLMDPNRQNYREGNILDIKDFQEAEVLAVKGATLFRPSTSLSPEEDPREDSSLLPLTVKLSDIRVDTEYVFNSPPIPESHLHPQTEAERRKPDCQAEGGLKGFFRLLIAHDDSGCADQMMCEGDYVMNSSILVNADVKRATGQTDCSALICDTDYIANSCFTAKNALENGGGGVSAAC
ncbi:hypothetical protein Q5P01_015338 [Channa striata]|uniref:Fibronectin type-III domain-containing protein n=1 Tax=Channa striata TaxID=64152 RepID=A0AA88MH78_CHASR|nr:hypothetical protein Q5P01_015338 [Channa striata]